MSILELSAVSHQAGGRLILDRATWRVDAGQHWAILGPNGGGKTTLLRIASGFLWPNAGGDVLRKGQRLVDLGDLRRSIGWVTLDTADRIPWAEHAIDTVVSGRVGQMGLRPRQLPRPIPPKVYEEANAWLATLGSDRLAEQALGTLSQGKRQIVLTARALMAEPMVIFLDEPCGGLDPGARETLLTALDKLASQTSDVSIVLVTHHVEEIMPAFSKTLIVAGGKTLNVGPTAEIVDEALLADLYRVEVKQLIRAGGRLWPIWGS